MPSLVASVISRGSLARSGQPVLEIDGDLRMRPWAPGDAPAVLTAFQDPDIQRWQLCTARSEEEAREWIDRWRRGWDEETGAHWAVVDAGDDALLGCMSLRSMSPVLGQAQISYWTVPGSRGRRVCSRALGALAGWALGTAGFHRLELGHSTTNAASCRVAEKRGFALEGIRRGALLHADGWHDMHLHARVEGV